MVARAHHRRPVVAVPLLAALLLAVPSTVRAQDGRYAVTGTVVDAATDEALASATVQVEGTYHGTVANADGRFELVLPRPSAVLVVRYIGYETRRIAVDAGTVRIALEPSPIALPELVVTGEDPAVRIMRRVIEEKQRRDALVQRYRAEAYTRLVIENDTGIVSMVESLTDVWWDRDRGSREVVRSRRQTANLDIDGFLPAASMVQNLYADDIEVAGHRLYGVTHPDALGIYDFRLEGTRSLDGQVVFDLSARPKSRLDSGFEGSIAVLDSVFVMIEVDLRPSSSFRFPPPIRFLNVRYRQQFAPFGHDAWLPVDFRASYDLKISVRGLLDFPVIGIRQTSGLGSYELDVELPDSLYASDAYLAVDSSSVADPRGMDRAPVMIPLTAREADALATIDSTQTLEQAFQPGGLLGRGMRMLASVEGDGATIGSGRTGGRPMRFEIRPGLALNRVAGWKGWLDVRMAHIRVGWISGKAGYEHGTGRAVLGAGAGLYLGRVRPFGEWSRSTEPRATSPIHGTLLNSVGYLLGGEDYFDYLDRDRVELGVRLRPTNRAEARVALRRDRDRSLDVSVPWTPFGPGDDRGNPPVAVGTLTSALARLSLGMPPDPFGLSGTNHATLEFERGLHDVLGGERSFTRFAVRLTGRIETLYRRRALPNALDLVIDGQVASDDLPVQRFGLVDGNGWWAEFGGLRTLGMHHYEGSAHLLVAWEHTFRTVPFELVGWEWAARQGWSLVLHGASATVRRARREEIGPYAPTRPWHHEIGFSLSGVLDFFRLDVTRRLDRADWAWSAGFARIF